MVMVKRRQNQKLPQKIGTPKMEGRKKATYHVKKERRGLGGCKYKWISKQAGNG